MKNLTIALLAAAAFTSVGCKKKKDDGAGAGEAVKGSGGEAAKGSGGEATPPAKGSATAVALPEGKPVSAKDLFMIDPPKPKNAPADGSWAPAYAEKDGDRLINYVNGNELYMGIRFLDCRADLVKKYVDKPGERGDLEDCFTAPTEKWKDYPAWKTEGKNRTIKVGNLIIYAGIGAAAEKLTLADVDEVLEGMDLAAIAKL